MELIYWNKLSICEKKELLSNTVKIQSVHNGWFFIYFDFYYEFHKSYDLSENNFDEALYMLKSRLSDIKKLNHLKSQKK